jgi:uncharacterized protein DUF4238
VNYLARFTDPGGFLWQYELDSGRVCRLAPKDAGVEKYLYAPEVGPEPHDDTMEVALAEEIDGPGSACIGKLIAGDSLTQEDRAQFSMYLAVMERRIPAQRDNVHRTVARSIRIQMQLLAAHPEALKAHVRDFLAREGEPYTEERFQEVWEFMARGEAPPPSKAYWLNILAASDDTAHTIETLRWLIVTAPDGVEFITSDRPIIKVLTSRDVPAIYGGGWLSPSAESTFVLDPSHCLVLTPDGPEGRIKGTPTWCRGVSVRTIALANRFVYSRSRPIYAEKVAAKHRRGRQDKQRSSPPQAP